jgi:chloramphenicol 3-O phosphotransferase
MTIVLLNGASSAGKSSIARALLDVLDTPWFHMAVDAFGEMRSEVRIPDADVAAMLTRTRAGFHRAVAGMASAGNDVVMDHVLSERWRLDDCLEVFTGLDVVFVGVHCPVEELARRELARGDRIPGQAAAHVAQVHAHGLYDVTVDSSRLTPAEAAAHIAAHLRERPPGPAAFDQLRGTVAG